VAVESARCRSTTRSGRSWRARPSGCSSMRTTSQPGCITDRPRWRAGSTSERRRRSSAFVDFPRERRPGSGRPSARTCSRARWPSCAATTRPRRA
jgi:hypothetical protein